MARLIKTDSSITDVTPKNGTDYSLEELQGYVGGYIEIITLDSEFIAVVNEEGLLQQLPHNLCASMVCDRQLVGDVLICRSEEVK